MSQPVTEDSKPDRTDQWAKLLPNVNWQFIPWRNLWFTSEGATSGKDSDDSKIVPNLTTSGTDTESRFIAESLSSSKDLAPPVEREDPHRDGDPPSLLTQPLLKMDVDLKKYCDGPRDLTHYITCTQGYPCSYGGFSGIWKCELESSQNGIENVAVKVFKVPSRNSEDMKNLIKKLRQEVFVWQRLEHSHILPLYGITNNFDIVPALVSPWMENGSLQQYLKTMWDAEQSPPEMHRLFRLLFQVILGLQYLHLENIIHGDLMPSNVLIDENGNALLADFGLSCLLADHETSFFGSLGPGAIRWAAPEIIPLNPETPNGEVSKPNKASDIYSFGCIMMQVLSGQSPYSHIVSEHAVTVAKFQGIPPRRPPAIADVHWCYIERCLSLDVDKPRPLVDEVLEYIKAECDRQKLTS